MRDAETQGLVLYSRNYKEKDKLVKIFTESFGKRMFFVKNFGKSPYASSLQAFTDGKLTATINDGDFLLSRMSVKWSFIKILVQIFSSMLMLLIS